MGTERNNPGPEDLRANRVPRPWPLDVYLFVFLVILGGLVVIAPGDLPDRRSMVFEIVTLLSLILLISLSIDEERSVSLQLIRTGYFLFPILYAFRLLHFLIPAIRDIDGSTGRALIQIDRWLLGDDVVAFFQPLRSPLLTEVMYYFYCTYYVVPIVLILVLFVFRYRDQVPLEALKKATGGIALGFITSYLLYILVPARGPLHELPPHALDEMKSAWIGTSIRRAILTIEMKMYDVFPSGHTEVYLITVLYSRRYTPSLYPWILFLFIGMLISTVYLQFHYVVDLIAGGGLAVLVVWFQDVLHNSFDRDKTTSP